MISITNVSPTNAPKTGNNHYVLKINKKLITSFEHNRTPRGLARCLRDAADAVEKQDLIKTDTDFEEFMASYLPAIKYSGTKNSA